MRSVIQRVCSASVTIDTVAIANIGQGLLVLIGIECDDTAQQAKKLAEKIVGLRIFEDEDGKMNHSLLDIRGEILVVSQFTLAASCETGRRPSFGSAAPPAVAEQRYEQFVDELRKLLPTGAVHTGVFRADMHVALVNDGPVTFVLEQ
mgnify:CR=1 FL=1